MSENFQKVADYVMGDDDSELAKTKAELAYALHALEREITIAQSEQSRSKALAKALKTLCDEIADTEMHGDGAYDQICSVCRAHKHARKLLRDLAQSPAVCEGK